MPARLVVLASGSGTTLAAILAAAAAEPGFGGEIVAVGSDRAGTMALRRAEDAGVETFVVPFADYADRALWNRAFEQALAGYRPDLVVLAGFMRILDARLVSRFRITNTHPALLPAFPGAHGVRDALAAGVAESGVTVHWVNEIVDGGPIIAQARVPVLPGDDEDALRERIQLVEKPLYVQAIRTLCQEYR